MRFILSLLMLCAMLAAPPAMAQVASGLVATPRALPVASSATNRPFLAAGQAAQPVNLAAASYVEEEFVISGLASLYGWGATPADPVTASEAGAPYTTRLLLRRPSEARRFSGRVIVELLDAAQGYDSAPLWGLSHAYFLARGDVWVGVTLMPDAVAALQRFDPVRYAALAVAPAQPADCTPATAHSDLAWDIIAQTGALLRSSSKENPLLLFEPRQLIVAGYSQAGNQVVTYANALHEQLRLGGGGPVYDGFLVAASEPLSAPISGCAAPLAEGDARHAVLPRDVPFVAVMTQADVGRQRTSPRDDSDDAGDEYRRYEIAGSAHPALPAGQPAAADLAIAGFDADEPRCAEPRNDFPLDLALNAIWRQYHERLAAGTPMNREPRIETDSSGMPLRDDSGNVRGGWRLPQIELPLAVYANDAASHYPCSLAGSVQRYDGSKLKQLHGSRGEYLRRFQAAVDAAVQARRLTPEDAAALKASLAKAVPAF